MSVLVVIGDDLEAGLATYLLAQVTPDIVRAATLAEAQRLLPTRSWWVVIFDTALPDGSGIDLLHTVGQATFESGILVLSASKAPADKVRALDAGADDYIVRPYEPSEFLARVRALVRRSHRRQRAGAQVVRVGDVCLDMNALEVILPGNRRQRLTPNEMRLLHYLMTHADRVIDQQELTRCLFGSDHPQMPSNAVGVYMRRVRRKIEPDPDDPRYIVTVRGHGYRFQGEGERAGNAARAASCSREHDQALGEHIPLAGPTLKLSM